VLLALGQFMAGSVDRHFVELDLQLAEDKLELVRVALADIRPPLDLAAIDARLAMVLQGHDDIALRVDGPDGQLWFSNLAGAALQPAAASAAVMAATTETPGLTRWADPAIPREHRHGASSPSGGPPPLALLRWSYEGVTFRGLARVLPTNLPGTPAAIVSVGVDTAHHEHYLASLRRALWGFVATAVVAMGLLGWAAARRGLAPLRTLGKAAERVTAQQLDRRLPVQDLPVEVGELAAQLNTMLARLEAAFDRLTALSSDLAHEMRTPVTGLITQTQVVLARPRDAAGYREALLANAQGLERLSRMVSDMLLLAKAENGLLPPMANTVPLAALARQVAEFHEGPAADRGLSLEVRGDSQAPGDRGLLARALSNLVSNAIRHAHAGTSVTISISGTPGGAMGGVAVQAAADVLSARAPCDPRPGVRVCVRNAGDALSDETLARMFDRFWRADAARARDPESAGLGLGLALVRSIARAHGGEAGASHRAGTTEVWIDLPGFSGPIASAAGSSRPAEP
jgi:two-component system heavy metal sensor histidine kinase CusS